MNYERMSLLKLSTRGRYGLRAMYELALDYDNNNNPMPIKSIAIKTGFSDQYLEQIFATLKKSNYVLSVRGAQGGYLLSRSPEEITVGDIIRCLDGPVEPSLCVSDVDPYTCSEDDCATRIVWKRLKDSIDECLDSITLKDMVENNI